MGIWLQNGPQVGPAAGGALLGPILEPDPHGMDPKIGPKIGPGIILIKPEALLHDLEYLPFRCANTYVFFSPARAPGTPNIGQKRGPRAPQISSDCPRKSLDFEAGVGDRLATLRVSRAKR